MRALVVLAHPEPRSFNAAMFRTAVEALRDAGHEVATSDLYAMPFDPVSDRRNFASAKDPAYFKQQVEETHATEVGGFAPDIETELKKLEGCDLMVWQFPLWWFGVPAILKGWVDRIFAMGRAYGGGRVYETGMFRGKRALLSLTTGGPEEAYARDGFNGDIEGILRPIHRGMLQFTGFDVLAPHVVYAPVRQTDERRKELLDEFVLRLRGIEREAPIDVGRY
jgi:NAD(P)H dehydrogenase (quinone)